jgi:DNA-binding CsgD family transcriptional regulator
MSGGARIIADRAVNGSRPVLVVKVDVAGPDEDGMPPRRCDVRLIRSRSNGNGSARSSAGRSLWSWDGGEITAVLILRDATPARVVSCVRAATRGGSISPELLHRLMPNGDGTSHERPYPQLSDREHEVLRMLADGESTRGIAERLCYSERTVKNIVHDLLATLGCKTRAHAVAAATRHGVI